MVVEKHRAQGVCWIAVAVACACGSSKHTGSGATGPGSNAAMSTATPIDDGGSSAPLPGTAVDPTSTNAATANTPPAASSSAPVATASPTASSPAPAQFDVKVENIGLHIGGGPNDAHTKAPFIDAIAPHFGAFAQCYETAQGKKAVTVSTDLLVSAAGGAAEVGEIRTGFKDGNFVDCVRNVFASVTFAAPKLGATRFSYSLQISHKGE